MKKKRKKVVGNSKGFTNVLKNLSTGDKSQIPLNYFLMASGKMPVGLHFAQSSFHNTRSFYCVNFYKPVSQIIS